MKRRGSGFLNTPICKGSTVIYESVAKLEDSQADPLKLSFPAYGRFGSPNVREFEDAIAELENGFGAVCTNSGLSSITTAILAIAKVGDHILLSGSIYKPTQNFADSLKNWGIEAEYYPATIRPENLSSMIRPNTRLVYLESPSSNTFQIQDVPGLSKICRQNGITTIMDNTWSTPLLFNPLNHGVDICIHSATKYISGHSDAILGVIVCNKKTYELVRMAAIRLGQCASSDDASLAMRGLRTLELRLRQHEAQALNLAHVLAERPEVEAVLHPALPSHPQHSLWRRDLRGSNGLFSVQLKSKFNKDAVVSMIESLRIFGLGYSWGGIESLLVPVEFNKEKGALLRIHVGLESIENLKSDLLQALATLNKVNG